MIPLFWFGVTVAKIVKASVKNDRKIAIEFDDGIKGEFSFHHYFKCKNEIANLADNNALEQMYISKDTDSLTWPNGFNICPDVLYSIVSAEKIIINGQVVYDPAI